jgi:hypothetical protein
MKAFSDVPLTEPPPWARDERAERFEALAGGRTWRPRTLPLRRQSTLLRLPWSGERHPLEQAAAAIVNALPSQSEGEWDRQPNAI